jgi:superfamily II DNA/RNA helicase
MRRAVLTVERRPGPSHPTIARATRAESWSLVSLSFAELGVPADLVDHLSARSIRAPFPIQAAAVPEALAGRDIAGRAPTGSGKTLAFGIPLAARVNRARPKRPKALVLVPTRELAAQVHRELTLLAGVRGRTATAVYGGVGMRAQIDALRRGTDIVVACPGRLTDLVERGVARLHEVDIVVIDEADRMADMGFLPEVRRILDQVRPDRQTLLFSATLDGDVDVLMRQYQRDPVRHELAAAAEEAAKTRHVFWRAEHGERVSLTAGVVTSQWPAVVFCRTKRGADRLARQLTASGVSATPLHGNLSQAQRERALAAFRSGRVQALVATDVAARGIHVDDVGCVVHFDLPADAKDYVHRSGRTGRAGADGLVVSMVGGEHLSTVRKLQAKLRLPAGVHPPDVARLGPVSRPPRSAVDSPVPAKVGGRPARNRRRRPARTTR